MSVSVYKSYNFKIIGNLDLAIPDATVRALKQFGQTRVKVDFPIGFDPNLLDALTELGFDDWHHYYSYDTFQIKTTGGYSLGQKAPDIWKVELVYHPDRIAIRLDVSEEKHAAFTARTGLKPNPKSKYNPKRADVMFDFFGEEIYEGCGVIVPRANEIFLGSVVSWTLKTVKVKIKDKWDTEKNYNPKMLCVIDQEKYIMHLLRS